MAWPTLISRTWGIDWNSKTGLAIDPYIVWADASRFAGIEPAFLREQRSGASSAPKRRVPVGFEVKLPLPRKGKLPREFKELRKLIWLPHARVGKRFATSAVPVAAIAYFFHPFVQRYFPRVELGVPTGSPNSDDAYAAALAAPQGPLGGSTASPVFAAVIDDGCAFANEAFIERREKLPPLSRIERLWFQEDHGVNPSGIGFTNTDLNVMLAAGTSGERLDEAKCYAALEQALHDRSADAAATDWKKQMCASAAHGTHVLDAVAGKSNPLASPRYGFGQAEDSASKAPIIFVQLPRAAVADTSGSSMTTHVLEALAYIGRSIGRRGRVVVNLSYGALAGPHDGTTLLEEAMDELIETDDRFMSIVLPAGNGYDSRTHASVVATNDGRWHDICVNLLPDDPTDTYVELWYAPLDPTGKAGDAVIDIEVVAPDGSTSGPVAAGEFRELKPADETEVEKKKRKEKLPIAALVHVRRPTAGGGKRTALLAVAPTRSDHPTLRPAAPHGIWTLRMRNRGGLAVVVDAWVERDDSPFGAGRSRSQAFFVNPGTGSKPGAAHAATFPVSRQGCLNSFAHGAWTRIVAGCSLHPPEVAKYSASGPGRKGQFKGPDVTAPCEDTPGSAIRAAGTRSAQPAYMNGTSVAAAVLSRQLINAAATRRRPLPDEDDLPLPTPDAKSLLPGPEEHPEGIAYPDPALRRGRGLLKPFE